jgi:hypothetical protein
MKLSLKRPHGVSAFILPLRGYALDSTTPNMLWLPKIKMVRHEFHDFFGLMANPLLLFHTQV